MRITVFLRPVDCPSKLSGLSMALGRPDTAQFSLVGLLSFDNIYVTKS